MKLEQQVTSLEISKRLKELGVKQESLFYYFKDAVDVGEWMYSFGIRDGQKLRGIDYSFDNVTGTMIDFFDDKQNEDDFYSAFTVAELGAMLPNSIISQEKQKHLQCAKLENGNHRVAYYSLYAYAPKNYISEKTEADARGKCLIYLIENNLITL